MNNRVCIQQFHHGSRQGSCQGTRTRKRRRRTTFPDSAFRDLLTDPAHRTLNRRGELRSILRTSQRSQPVIGLATAGGNGGGGDTGGGVARRPAGSGSADQTRGKQVVNAGGGSRTHMPCQGRWILNPVCLPFHHSGPLPASPNAPGHPKWTTDAGRKFAAQAMLPVRRRESRVRAWQAASLPDRTWRDRSKIGDEVANRRNGMVGWLPILCIS